MLRLSNIRIGARLAMMSGVTILLVAVLIVSQLMTGAQIKQANINTDRRTDLALDAALDGALMLVGPRLGRQGVRLEDGRAGPSPRVRADAMRLEQVFVNLLHNALEALAQAERPCVRLSVARAGGRVRVRIEDNGPGIDPAAREHLFTPFFTTRAQGVGLGLVISRDILAEFGGTLEALDAARGAAFEVALEPMEEGA